MPIETKTRKITSFPPYAIYKPPRIPMKDLNQIVMTFEEFEAIRLFDYLKKDQNEAAELMTISQPTFSRTLNSARKKLAIAIVEGQALVLEGGTITIACFIYKCNRCSYQWSRKDSIQVTKCKQCDSDDIERIYDGSNYKNP